MDRPTLQEQLDACRDAASPTDDPLLRELDAALKSDPQIAKQLANQLDADAQVKAELESISVPSDLQEKLLLAFRQGSEQHELDRARNRDVVGQAVVSAAKTAEAAANADQAKPVLKPRRRLPKKTIAGLLTIAAALLVVFAFQRSPSNQEVDLNGKQFAEAALKHCEDQKVVWNNISTLPTSVNWNGAALPLAKNLQPLKWRKVESSQRGEWILWELDSTAGERVYVLTADAKWKTGLLPAVLSQNPTIPSSGTWSVGVFRNGDISYAVVVEGSAARFRRLVQPRNTASIRVAPRHLVVGKAA
jgi:hypothetical protein